MPGISACAPFRYETADDEANASLTEEGAILPCGQISQSFFNDTYQFTLQQNVDGADAATATATAVIEQQLPVDDSNIAWSGDKNHLYGNVTAINYNTDATLRGGNTTTLPLNENQHWMVWQRPGGQTPMQKLYGQINSAIPAGSVVQLTVTNRYNTYGFGGSKKVILTTNSWVGGRNLVLPGVYLATAGVCYATALLFFVGFDLGWIRKRQPGLEDDFSWVRHALSDENVVGNSQPRGATPTSVFRPAGSE